MNDEDVIKGMALSPDDGPVVIVKDAPGKYCHNREWEWFASCTLFSIGIVILFTPRTIEAGAFRYLLSMGFESEWIWPLLCGIGLLRIVALFFNGRQPFYGPHARAAGCLAGAVIWSMMALALIRLTVDTNTISIGIPAWVWATIFELKTLRRALIDVGIGR